MKARNKAMSVIVLLALLLSFFSFADDAFDANNFDYNNPEGYNNLGVKEWKQLKQELVPVDQIPLIPPEVLDYSKIKDDEAKRQALTVEQVKVNLEKIDNIADVNKENAQLAINEKYSVNVLGFGTFAKVENGVLKATEGDFVFSGKKGWEIAVVKKIGRIFVFKPTEISATSISQQDYFTLTEEVVSYTPASGSPIKIKLLNFKEGKSFIRAKEEATIGDYKIPASGNPVDIYFDATVKPEGNYIVITDKSLDIGTTKEGTVKVIPQPGNKLFNMVKRQYKLDAEGKPINKDEFTPVPDERDKLEITISGGDNLKVGSREGLERTPLLKHVNGGGKCVIETGRGMRFSIVDGQIKVDPPASSFTSLREEGIDDINSVAFELVSDVEENAVYRTSSSNRYIEFKNGERVNGNNMGLEVSDLIKPNMVKTVEDLQVTYPKIAFRGGTIVVFESDAPAPTTALLQLTDEWLREKEGIERYIGDIFFEEESDDSNAGFAKDIFKSGKEYMILTGNVMDLVAGGRSPVRDLKNPLQVLDHEFAHAIDTYLRNRELEEFINKNRDTPSFKELLETRLRENNGFLLENAVQMGVARELFLAQNPSDSFVGNLEMARGYTSISQPTGQFWETRPFRDFLEEHNKLRKENNLEPLKPGEIMPGWKDLLGQNQFFNGFEDTPDTTQRKVKEGFQKLDRAVLNPTGLYGYSYEYSEQKGSELFSTYGELPPETARKNPELAQVEYDRIMSVDPPDWLKKKAEDRYYSIMGGRNGPYCSKNPCGPCLKYKVLCKP